MAKFSSDLIPLSPDIVGMSLADVETTWTPKDVILYALGVGAGPRDELEFLYEVHGPAVIPTFAVIPGRVKFLGELMTLVDAPWDAGLHAEEVVEIHRALPPAATVTARPRVTEVWDKGRSALVGIESTTEDAAGPLFTSRTLIYLPEGGGFGGDRGPGRSARVDHGREPDEVVEFETRHDQPVLYRLSGDLNPIHIDPDFAHARGFDGPILHGLCTYGFAARGLLLGVCPQDPSRLKKLSARFLHHIYPGQTLRVSLWRLGDQQVALEIVAVDGDVLAMEGTATCDI